MKIETMFAKDINRPINGVIKVDQSDEEVIEQELDEYVITAELRKHFRAFFSYYCQAYDTPTADIGVWISGFFGSGKSHFLKMLSYLLADRRVGGVRTSERFLAKVADDPELARGIRRAATGHTDAILFNIDIAGPGKKDDNAVIKVFAKMFYQHLGFFGDDLKVAKLEQFISRQGKWEEFQRVFADVHGDSWLESRDAFGFYEDEIIEVLGRVLGMSEQSARDWFNGTETAEISIDQLVREIKAYVDTKPDDYRLLFMADEVGQYIGTDAGMLLNMQSLTEELGAKCRGKVWVMATGQEALDEVVKVRRDAFSKIIGRFKTRLSLSSSSVDEVIERRILAKNEAAQKTLAKTYEESRASLDNLFVFREAKSDLKGFSSTADFAADYPFVSYQFLLLQKVFYEVRKHGNTGKHLAGGERSMLSSFQEAARAIEGQDEHALAPFFLFYDTMRGFLDSSINRVVDRCAKAAAHDEGLQPYDVDVLKCLYLIRYLEDDLPGNADNLMILMADRVDTDKLLLRQQVNESLDRLQSQNYISRTGDVFKFLTDEEQDIQRSILATDVDPTKITERIGALIYGDIYPVKKFRWDVYDFPFLSMVDDVTIGSAQGGMTLQFLTSAAEQAGDELRLITESKGRAIVVLSEESRYYELLEESMRIRQFVNVSLGKNYTPTAKVVIATQEANASQLEERVAGEIERAITQGTFYVDGEKITVRAGTAKGKIDQALAYLVTHVYRSLSLVTHHVEDDDAIRAILHGDAQLTLGSGEDNAAAAAKVEEYLTLRAQQKQKTTMGDIQKRYQDIPYGWREIDIAAVMALLIAGQRVTVKYAGETVRASDPRLVDLLRKRTEIGKTVVRKHTLMSVQKIRAAAAFFEDYLGRLDIPQDENGLVEFILTTLKQKKQDYRSLLARYGGFNPVKYPGERVLRQAIEYIDRILAKQTDNLALVDALLACKEDFEEIFDELDNVENFFGNQAAIFEEAFYFEQNMRRDLEYLEEQPETIKKLDQIRLILLVDEDKTYDYTRIQELRPLVADVRAAHDALLDAERQKNYDVIRQCVNSIYEAGSQAEYVRDQIDLADTYYKKQRRHIEETGSIIELKGVAQTLFEQQSRTVAGIQRAIKAHEEKLKPQPPAPVEKGSEQGTSVTKMQPVSKPEPKVSRLYRQTLFPLATLRTEADIDRYLAHVRAQIVTVLRRVDEVQLR